MVLEGPQAHLALLQWPRFFGLYLVRKLTLHFSWSGDSFVWCWSEGKNLVTSLFGMLKLLFALSKFSCWKEKEISLISNPLCIFSPSKSISSDCFPPKIIPNTGSAHFHQPAKSFSRANSHLWALCENGKMAPQNLWTSPAIWRVLVETHSRTHKPGGRSWKVDWKIRT